jgi:abortive infection bacteriophage resistance protein
VSTPFTKSWLSLADQVAKLRGYGLVVSDQPQAEVFLRHLNYYRFSGYGLAFESARHTFNPGTRFEDIRAAYEFDRDLRDLVYESMEVIELDVRTTVAYTYGHSHGAFGHTDARNFYKTFQHRDWLGKLQNETDRSRERFVKHFKETYREYPDLPIWMATEIMSFGALSRMISGMHKADQKVIASHYRMPVPHFVSCLHHLVYIRNICAHHARLWDREWAIKPELPPGKAWSPPLLPGNDRLFASLLLQAKLMESCRAERTFSHQWRGKVETLINLLRPTCPYALEKMGLTTNWYEHPFWQAS